MLRSFCSITLHRKAPISIGAFFCMIGIGLFLAATISCERSNSSTATSDLLGSQPPIQPEQNAEDLDDPLPAAEGNQMRKHEGSAPTKTGFRFINYNVKNWLLMERYADGKTTQNAPKPDAEKIAAIHLLSRHHPDVLGLCEIGQPDDLKEIQTRLKQEGIDLPFSHFTQGGDENRRLGLLSRFPITGSAVPKVASYQLDGKSHPINRGILDVTLTARGKEYRLLGVHLKSKRASDQGDQEAIRFEESKLLRKHIETIFDQTPAARLIVYGDFNDTRSSRPMKKILSSYGKPRYLTPIPARDRSGEFWTHHWALHDVYSRIDFVLVSEALKSEVRYDRSRILDDADWIHASDHRPVMVIFR
ncbi:MAG: endonuclease/exonuclease/phosphatase family protein [Verrucomicrobia bacterium]|nr:MAG: endonuclease/exonuclease/phosphatase family protein [Verrucomicrobiota bacterium]